MTAAIDIPDAVQSAFLAIGKKIVSFKDVSNGADQKVLLVTCEDQRYIYKEPLFHPEVITNEVLACKVAAQAEVPAPIIITYAKEFLIETVIEGKELTHYNKQEQIYEELGKLLRRLHSITAPAFGELPETHRTGLECIEARLNPELETIRSRFDGALLDALWNKRHELLSISEPVYLHRDLGAEHIFVLNDTISGIVDWADIGGGYPEEDFAIIYMEHQDSSNYRSVLKGYGTAINHERVLFYVAAKLARQIGKKLRNNEEPPPRKIDLMQKMLLALSK